MTSGVDIDSIRREEKAALDIVNAATLAYCPKYNTSDLVKPLSCRRETCEPSHVVDYVDSELSRRRGPSL